MGETLAEYPSSSNPDKIYRVQKGADGVIYCDCTGWKMRKDCKHLKEYRASSGQSPACLPTISATPKTSKVSNSTISIAKNGLMVTDVVNPDVFRSDSFQSLPWYQGCSAEIDGDTESIIKSLSEIEATNKYVAEPKLDGIWIAAFSDGNGVRFWSRNQKEKAYGLNNWKLPAGTLLIGELGFGSEHALQRRAQYGYDFMDVFGILIQDYKPLLYKLESDRRVDLENFMAGQSAETRKHFKLVPRWYSDFADRFKTEHEGLVLKTADQQYQGRGSKVSYWMKAKKWMEADMVIMDYTISKAETKQSEPMVENVICGAYVNGVLKPLVKVGAMTSAWSKEFAKNFNKYKGKVMVIAHYQQFASGSLRHPSMMGIREDKSANDCVFVKKG